MNQYLLSVYEVEGKVDGTPATPEEMRSFMARVIALEAEMEAPARSCSAGHYTAPRPPP